MSSQKTKIRWLLAPVIGIIVFIVLYIVAAMLYPGGSGTDRASVGYSLTNNYWCNLLNKTGINGENNPGKIFAATGMLVICFSLSCFWIFFPIEIGLAKSRRLLIQIPGALGMAGSLLLMTDLDHDVIVNSSSLLGFIATAGTLIALYKIKWHKLFVFGLFNVMLIALNNHFYYSKGMIIYLPILQIITFISFLSWFCAISITCLLSARVFTWKN